MLFCSHVQRVSFVFLHHVFNALFDFLCTPFALSSSIDTSGHAGDDCHKIVSQFVACIAWKDRLNNAVGSYYTKISLYATRFFISSLLFFAVLMGHLRSFPLEICTEPWWGLHGTLVGFARNPGGVHFFLQTLLAFALFIG